MRALHIIPTAFNYFDDIRAAAFRLVEALSNFGVEVEALTIEYQAPTLRVKAEVKTAAPSRHYRGTVGMEEVERNLQYFDVLHVHAPGLGAVARVLAWKRQRPKLPLVVTVYRPVQTPDVFSFLIWAYNLWYLPRLFRAAEIIAFPSGSVFKKFWFRSARQFRPKCLEINDAPEAPPAASQGETGLSARLAALTESQELAVLTPPDRLAWKYATVYNELVRLKEGKKRLEPLQL